MAVQEETRLQQELQAYGKHRTELLSDAGKFVVIQSDDIIGVWDTYEDALRVGYQKFGVDIPFLVKKIDVIERVKFCSLNLACQH